MSIQLALDGHSFCSQEQTTSSIAKLQAQVTEALKVGGVDLTDGEMACDLEFVLLTARTIVVPEQILEASCQPDDLQPLCAGLLAASGMPIKAKERAVVSAPSAGAVAIMAIDCQLDDALQAIARGQYTTPLLAQTQFARPTIWVEQITGLLYIKVYAPTLQLCEVVAAQSEEEIIYLFEMLSREFTPRNYELVIASGEPKKLKKLIGGGYAKVICNKK